MKQERVVNRISRVVLVLAVTLCGTAQAQDAPHKAPDTTPSPTFTPDVSPEARAVLDRVIKHYAPFKGIKCTARHQITAPTRIIHEQVRGIEIVKPSCFRITADGYILTTSDGRTRWRVNRQEGAYYNAPAAPASLFKAIREARELGGESIAGSGGLVTALMCKKPMDVLTRDMSSVSVRQMGDNQVLIFKVAKMIGTVRAGTMIGVVVPAAGPAWIRQADIVPPDGEIFTRVVFEGWAPCDLSPEAFELDPELPRMQPTPPSEG